MASSLIDENTPQVTEVRLSELQVSILFYDKSASKADVQLPVLTWCTGLVLRVWSFFVKQGEFFHFSFPITVVQDSGFLVSS